MNDIKFECPRCKQHLEAPPDMCGERIECPTCKHELLIPSLSINQMQPTPAPMPNFELVWAWTSLLLTLCLTAAVAAGVWHRWGVTWALICIFPVFLLFFFPLRFGTGDPLSPRGVLIATFRRCIEVCVVSGMMIFFGIESAIISVFVLFFWGSPTCKKEKESPILDKAMRVDCLLRGLVRLIVCIIISMTIMAAWLPRRYMPDRFINPQPFAKEFPNPIDPTGPIFVSVIHASGKTYTSPSGPEVCWFPGCNRPAPRFHPEYLPDGARYKASAVNQPKLCQMHKDHLWWGWKFIFYWIKYMFPINIGFLLFGSFLSVFLAISAVKNFHACVTGVGLNDDDSYLLEPNKGLEGTGDPLRDPPAPQP